MIARGYVRESTERQGEKFGPDAQRSAIRRAAVEIGAELDETHWHVDLLSGTGRVERDGLAAAIADAREHAYDVLIVYDTSRFARNERLAFDFEWQMHSAGRRVFYVREGIWADDRRSAIHKGVMHVLNAQYSRDLSERVRDGIAAKKARSGYHGGIPWGYRYSADKMRIEPDPETHPVRILAWQLYATGEHTFETLAQELNRRGHRLFTRGRLREFTRYTFQEWSESRVDVEVGGLDPKVYAAAMAVVARHRRSAEKVTQRRHRYVFASLMRCGTCGESFWGRMRHKGPRPPRPIIEHAPRGCRNGRVTEERLTEQMGEFLATWRLPPDAKAKVARYIAARRVTDPNAERRRTLAAELDRLAKLFRWGHFADDRAYLAGRERVQRELDALGPAPIDRIPSREALKLVDRIGQAWNDVSPETRRRFLEEWYERIVFHEGGRLEVHPRAAYAPIVFAAVGGQHGGVESSTAHGAGPGVLVAGLPDWIAFWASEATA